MIEHDADEIFPHLWLGNIKAANNPNFIKQNNIKYIFTIMDKKTDRFDGVTYYVVPISDKLVCGMNMVDAMHVLVDEIKHLINDNNIFVHCKNGHHRSAVIVAAFLIKYVGLDYDIVVKYINSIRPLALRRKTCMSMHLVTFNKQITGKNECEWKEINNEVGGVYCLCKTTS